jgi:hypothetical protein
MATKKAVKPVKKSKPKIEIKPSKKGTFTKFAKKKGMVDEEGKITSEAIDSGLKSKDPAIKKKAVFAMNARKWAKAKKKGK